MNEDLYVSIYCFSFMSCGFPLPIYHVMVVNQSRLNLFPNITLYSSIFAFLHLCHLYKNIYEKGIIHPSHCTSNTWLTTNTFHGGEMERNLCLIMFLSYTVQCNVDRWHLLDWSNQLHRFGLEGKTSGTRIGNAIWRPRVCAPSRFGVWISVPIQVFGGLHLQSVTAL